MFALVCCYFYSLDKYALVTAKEVNHGQEIGRKKGRSGES